MGGLETGYMDDVRTIYYALLENPPIPGDSISANRNRELYNKLRKTGVNGAAMLIVERSPKNDGHAVILNLLDWYETAELAAFEIKNDIEGVKSRRNKLNGGGDATFNKSKIKCPEFPGFLF
jgi:hypothetical protein